MESKRTGSKNTKVSLPYNETLMAQLQNNGDASNSLVFQGKSVIVTNGDIAKVGSAVIFNSGPEVSCCIHSPQPIIIFIFYFKWGVVLVQEILMQQINSEKVSLITLQLFDFFTKRHDLLDLPLLKKANTYRTMSPHVSEKKNS